MATVDVSKTYIDDAISGAITDTHDTVPVPVGGVILLATTDNPRTLLGYGTWVLLGPGQLIV